MLAKILEEMWVEPEVLEALSEEQKRILFVKMREEQVRRWTAREGREEREERGGEEREENDHHGGPRKASGKHVTWLLGRDGDVRVSVIGEEDEFRSSKLLRSLLNNRYDDACLVDVRPAAPFPPRETDPHGHRRGLAKSRSLDQELECRSVAVERGAAAAAAAAAAEEEEKEEEKEEKEKEEEKEEGEEEEDSDCEPTAAGSGGGGGGGSNDELDRDGAPLRKLGLRNHGNRPPPLRALSLDADRTRLPDGEAPGGRDKDSGFGARVAELKRTPAPGAPVSSKPPVPVKPPHLQTGYSAVPRPGPEGIAAS